MAYEIFGDHPAPVIMIHWGAAGETDEFEEARQVLEIYLPEALAGRQPDVCYCRVHEADPNEFLQGLSELIGKNPDFQTVYISAHGNTQGLSFDSIGRRFVIYRDICRILNVGTLTRTSLRLVLGSCEAMSEDVKIESFLGRSFSEVAGFTATPKADDVAALMAGVMKSDMELFGKLSEANKSVCAAAKHPVSLEQFSREIQSRFEQVVDEHVDKPAELVVNNAGVFVVVAKRDPQSGNWKRRRQRLRRGHNI